MKEIQPGLAMSVGIKEIGAYEGRAFRGLVMPSAEALGDEQVYYARGTELDRLPLPVSDLVAVTDGLDYFLAGVEPSVSPQTVPSERQADFFERDGLAMSYIGYGSESIAFRLEFGDAQFVVKAGQNILYYPRGFNEYPLWYKSMG